VWPFDGPALKAFFLLSLDLLAARGKIEIRYWYDPGIAVLEKRGVQHEAAYLARLEKGGFEVLALDNDSDWVVIKDHRSGVRGGRSRTAFIGFSSATFVHWRWRILS